MRSGQYEVVNISRGQFQTGIEWKVMENREKGRGERENAGVSDSGRNEIESTHKVPKKGV